VTLRQGVRHGAKDHLRVDLRINGHKLWVARPTVSVSRLTARSTAPMMPCRFTICHVRDARVVLPFLSDKIRS
jgi:hypothetical protein